MQWKLMRISRLIPIFVYTFTVLVMLGLFGVDENVFVGNRGKAGLHKLWYPVVRDMSTWSKFGAHGEHGDVFLFSNLGAL